MNLGPFPDTGPLPPPVSLRRATADDVPALAALYAVAAEQLGPQVYTADQVRAWQSFGRDTPAFRDYVLGAETWLADSAAGPAGFCGFDAAGEVRSLYVHPSLGRRGIGSALLTHVLGCASAAGLGHLEVWVTPFSRPLFERAGFTLVEVRREPYQGVVFDRYRLHRG